MDTNQERMDAYSRSMFGMTLDKVYESIDKISNLKQRLNASELEVKKLKQATDDLITFCKKHGLSPDEVMKSKKEDIDT